jgi:hypothetical protein
MARNLKATKDKNMGREKITQLVILTNRHRAHGDRQATRAKTYYQCGGQK